MEALTLATEVLEWAAQQAGETLASLAPELSKRDSERIVRGRLTVAQAKKLADRARVPFGFLFLTEPPEVAEPEVADLRQTVDSLPLSKDYFETVRDAVAKQDWFREYLTEIGAETIPYVGSFDVKAKPEDVAESIHSALGLYGTVRAKSANPSEYFSQFASLTESAGILVLKSGIVRSNTHRPLSVREFRGFALADKLAPLVFVNGKDAPAAMVFTLAHELAHVWLGVSAVSDVRSDPSNPIEILCNRIAAELLVPLKLFQQKWTDASRIGDLAVFFRVSKVVIARRALDVGLIAQNVYNQVSNAQEKDFRKKRKSGGDAYNTLPVRNSKLFTRTLVDKAMAGQVLLRDAARLLNVGPKTVVGLSVERE